MQLSIITGESCKSGSDDDIDRAPPDIPPIPPTLPFPDVIPHPGGDDILIQSPDFRVLNKRIAAKCFCYAAFNLIAKVLICKNKTKSGKSNENLIISSFLCNVSTRT